MVDGPYEFTLGLLLAKALLELRAKEVGFSVGRLSECYNFLLLLTSRSPCDCRRKGTFAPLPQGYFGRFTVAYCTPIFPKFFFATVFCDENIENWPLSSDIFFLARSGEICSKFLASALSSTDSTGAVVAVPTLSRVFLLILLAGLLSVLNMLARVVVALL